MTRYHSDALTYNNVPNHRSYCTRIIMWKRRPQILTCCSTIRKVQQRCQISSLRPLIDLKNATFYPEHVPDRASSKSTSHLFSGITLTIPALSNGKTGSVVNPYTLGVTSHSARATTTFLKILSGQYFCDPPIARSYPYLAEVSKTPQTAIQYVGFDAERGNSVGGNSLRGAYLSARYESRREELDFTVRDYLQGNTELNALSQMMSQASLKFLNSIVSLVGLKPYLDMPVTNLSNGQTRRARIARAFMKNPELVIIDGPYMGLDPLSRISIDKALRSLSHSTGIRLVLGFTKDHDEIPPWLTDLVAIKSDSTVFYSGAFPPPKEAEFATNADMRVLLTGVGHVERSKGGGEDTAMPHVIKGPRSRDGFEQISPPLSPGEALVEMRGVRVAYGDKTVLGGWTQKVDGDDRPGLWWSLHRGQRCGIFGPNGSGKTTMLSLITSDHPQTYSLPIDIFGRSRLPGHGQPGISLFDIQKRMGHSSPEVHAFFPKQLTVRRAIESAWADAPLARPHITETNGRRIDACLRWFARELDPTSRGTKTSPVEELETAFEHMASQDFRADDAETLRKTYETAIESDEDVEWARHSKFGELSFSNQRLILFLRAIVAEPDLVILDEAFSGMDATTRDRALLFLSQGERIARVHGYGSTQTVPGTRESVISILGKVCVNGLSSEQALLVISHSKEDVPGCVREWICLPEPGEGHTPRLGALSGPLELNPRGWDDIWGLRRDAELEGKRA
nr:putative abc transporter atp-binding protein [Quercus suber]